MRLKPAANSIRSPVEPRGVRIFFCFQLKLILAFFQSAAALPTVSSLS